MGYTSTSIFFHTFFNAFSLIILSHFNAFIGSLNDTERLAMNHSQLSCVSAFVKAKAIGNNLWFASRVTDTIKTPGYLPRRCDASTAIVGLSDDVNDRMQGPKA